MQDFWPYFKAAATRYVGANAEEIQAESKREGNLIGWRARLLRSRPWRLDRRTRRGEIRQERTLRDEIRAAKAKDTALTELGPF